MGNKLEVIGANLVPDTPASFSSAPQQIAPVSALDDAKAAKKYDDNKFDKLFSWETPKAVLEGMPTMGILNVAADKISPYIPEVKISDTLSFGGQGPLITNSQPVTDERLEQYAKSMNVPEEYWQDLRASKDMTEVYIKTGRILSDIKGQQHLAQVYGSTALTMGSVFFDPTFYLGNEAGNLMAASVKSASIAKSLAAVGALKQTTVATKVAEAVSSMGKALPAQASAVASKAASVTEAAAGKSGGFLVDTLNYSGTNVLLGELDANVRGRETTPTEFYMNALVGAVAPHVIGAIGKTYTASNAWLHNRTVKALNEIGAKAAQEKFQVEPTDKLNEMTIGEKVSHGDEAIEPRLSDTGPAQGELFDATGAHPKDPQLDSMVRALLGDEPVMTEGVAPEGQLELDFLGEPKRVPVETPEVAPVVETTPVVEAEPVASPDVPTEIVTPKELLRARPSYTLDGVRFTPRFKSTIDKALFIVGQDARSAHDAKYMEMLRQVFPKLSDAEIREAGQGIKAQHMRSNAKVAIETKGLPRGTAAELPVDTTWKDNVNPIGKDHEPVTHEVGPVVPKEGLQPEQLKELEAATPEVQQKVVQKVLDEKVADTPLRFNPKDAAQPYARDVEEISSLLEPLVVKDGNRLYTTLKEPLVINTEGASKGVIKLAKAVQNVDGPFVQGTTQDGKPVDFSLDELKAALTKTEPKVIPAADQKDNTLHPALEGFPALGVSREVRDGPLFKGNASLIKGLDHAVSSLGKLDSIGLHFNFKKPVEIKYSFESGGSTVEATGVIKAIQRGSIQDSNGELIVKVQMVREGYSRAAWVDLPIAAVAKALKAEPMEYAPKAEPTVIPAADQKAYDELVAPKFNDKVRRLEQLLSKDKLTSDDMKLMDSLAQDPDGWGNQTGGVLLITPEQGAKLKALKDARKVDSEKYSELSSAIATLKEKQVRLQRQVNGADEFNVKHGAELVALEEELFQLTRRMSGKQSLENLIRRQMFRNDARTVGEATIENGELHLETAGRSFQSFEELPQVPSGRVFIKTKSPAYPIETTVTTQKGQVFPTVTVRVPEGFSKTITGKPLQEAMATLQDALRNGLKGNVDYSTPSINEALSAERLAGLKKAGFKKETTDTKAETTVIPAADQKVEIKTDYGMNDHFTAALEADLNAWKARENIQDSDTEGYGWEIRKTGLHGALRLLTFFPGKGRMDFDIKSQAEGIAKIRGMIADAPNDQLNIQKRWDAFNEEASKVQQQVVQKDVAQKDGVSAQTDGINSYDAPGVSAIKELVAGKPVGPDGFVSVSMMTAREVSVYKKAAYTDPWGTGKKIPTAEKLKDIKKPIAILEIDPVPVRIPNEFFPDTGDFAYFRVKAQLPGKKTPQEVMLKAWSFEGTPKAPKGNQAGFITPGVALGLLAGSGLGVYAVGQASQGKDLKETLGSALSGLGGLMILGMTKGNKSVLEALAHGKTLADVVKLPEVKANPEAVTLKTAQGQDLKLIDLAAKTGRLTDGTPFHMGTIRLPFFGKTRVSDPSGEISAEIRNSDSETGRSLGNLIASSIAGHKTKGAMNHTTADVYAQSTAKSAIHAVGDAFDKGFIAWANRDGKVSPDFIKAYSKKLVTEFNDQVVRAKKGETEGVHPEAIKAAKAIADSEARLLQMAADLLKEGKARDVVAEGSAWDLTGQIVAEPTYVHRSASSRGLYELTASVGIEKVHLLIQRALQKGNPELSPQFAAEMAPAYAKTLASLEHYPGLKVNDMNPDELLQHIKDVTQLTPEKAEELSNLFMGHKAADGVSGILKKRTQLDDTFEMPTTDLQGNPVTISMRQLFNQDIRMNHAHWVNSVSGVLGMARVSLDAGVDLTHGATFQRLLDQMKGELLEKSVPYNRAMKQVDTIRDLHAKILGKQNAEGIFKPANEAIRLLNDTTTLLSHAGFVFSAGAELAAAVQRRGLESALNDMPELGQVVKAALGGEIDDGLARSLITAHALGDHQTAAMQLGLEQGNLSGASGAVQTAIGQTAKMNFFSTATASTKYLAIKAALQELSDVARGVRTLTPEQWNHFKLRGMSQELLEEIKPALLKATSVDENGMLLTDGSGYRPLDMFKDNAKAAMDLHAHLDRQGNAAASESSGAGETNRYMHNDIGRTLGKFQGTPLIMTAKLKGNLNNFDASVAASWITTSLGAALAYIMSTYVSNHGDQETMKKKLTTKEIAKAAFRNGFSGIAPNVIDLAATMTGQEAPFAGVTNSGRQGGVDVPAFRTIQRVKDTAATVGHALTGQQVTRAEAAQAVKTPLWALNVFIPFATQSLPKKRTDKPKD